MFSRDWSSDVCSSDLFRRLHRGVQRNAGLKGAIVANLRGPVVARKIGRASCRERVKMSYEALLCIKLQVMEAVMICVSMKTGSQFLQDGQSRDGCNLK